MEKFRKVQSLDVSPSEYRRLYKLIEHEKKTQKNIAKRMRSGDRFINTSNNPFSLSSITKAKFSNFKLYASPNHSSKSPNKASAPKSKINLRDISPFRGKSEKKVVDRLQKKEQLKTDPTFLR